MKTIILIDADNTSELKYSDQPIPEVRESEVLIKVKAISINPIDVKTRRGKGIYPRIKNENPLILGWDLSGVVVQSNSELFKVDDEVFGMNNFPGHGKVYAEYVAASAKHLTLKPQNVSHEEAAAATLAALTAYQSLIYTGGVGPNQKILIHAAAGGVGHYAVQIAKHLGAYVVGTSSIANRNFVLQLGANEHIDYHTDEMEKGHKDFDVVLDTIGGDNIDRSLSLIKPGGKLISIPSGKNNTVAAKAQERGISGHMFIVQSNGDDMKKIADYLGQHFIKSHVSKTFSFDDMESAHKQIESGHTIGKVVVIM
jgi:NADPH:quinone reductase-like Zn-dependent oxidoreductase